MERVTGIVQERLLGRSLFDIFPAEKVLIIRGRNITNAAISTHFLNQCSIECCGASN